MNNEIKKQLLENLSGTINCKIFHFTTTLSKFERDLDEQVEKKTKKSKKNKEVENIYIPKHQRVQVIDKKKETMWIAAMLTQSLQSLAQRGSVSIDVATRFGLVNKNGIVPYNTQRFGIWYNTDPSNGYNKINIEEGAHRKQYYADFIANECVIKDTILKKMPKYEASVLEKLFTVCNTDVISYAILKDFGLTSLIKDVPVDVDIVESPDHEIGAQMFINMNNSVAVKGADIRRNRFVDYYLYTLISSLHSNLLTGAPFSLGGASYSKEDVENLRYVLSVTPNSHGKVFDSISRCMLANKDLKDGHNWAAFISGQNNVVENLFKRYPSKDVDMTTSADFYDTIKKIAKLGEILKFTKDSLTGTTSLLGIGSDKHNFAQGAANLPTQFILFHNDITKEFTGITNEQYAEIFKAVSYAFVYHTKYVSRDLSTESFKKTPHNYTLQRSVADVFVAVARDMLEEK